MGGRNDLLNSDILVLKRDNRDYDLCGETDGAIMPEV